MSLYHFRITTEGQTYDFNLETHAGPASILIGNDQYSIIPKRPEDLSKIQKIIEKALTNEVVTINGLSERLSHLPMVTDCSMEIVQKTSEIGMPVIISQKSALTFEKNASILRQTKLIPVMLENVRKIKGFTGDVYLSTPESELLTSPRIDDKVDLASIGKLFTAAAAVELHKQGKLDLDQPIAKYLGSEFPHGDKITLRHLLTHTHGAHTDWKQPEKLDSELEQADRLVCKNRSNGAKSELNPYLKLLKKRFASSWNKDLFGNFKYGNEGHELAGIILERIEEKPFSQILNECVFVPLRMVAGFGQEFENTNPLPSACGGIQASPRNMITFGNQLCSAIRGDPNANSTLVEMYGNGQHTISLSSPLPDYWGHGGAISTPTNQKWLTVSRELAVSKNVALFIVSPESQAISEKELPPARQLFIAVHQLLHLPEWEQKLLARGNMEASAIREKEETRIVSGHFLNENAEEAWEKEGGIQLTALERLLMSI